MWQFVFSGIDPDTGEETRFFCKEGAQLPAVKEAWQDSSIANNIYIKAFYEQFHHVVATPKIPEWEQIAFSKVQQYAELAARGVMSVDEALMNLDKDVDQILEKRRWLVGGGDD